MLAGAPAPNPLQSNATSITETESLTNSSSAPSKGDRRLLAAAPKTLDPSSGDQSSGPLSKAAAMALAQTQFVQKQLRMQARAKVLPSMYPYLPHYAAKVFDS